MQTLISTKKITVTNEYVGYGSGGSSIGWTGKTIWKKKKFSERIWRIVNPRERRKTSGPGRTHEAIDGRRRLRREERRNNIQTSYGAACVRTLRTPAPSPRRASDENRRRCFSRTSVVVGERTGWRSESKNKRACTASADYYYYYYYYSTAVRRR